jgi:transketolase
MDTTELCVNTIRTLSADMVTRANSGHPGAPLGCAAIAYSLFGRVMNYDPTDPEWPDRDRFILSAGHASALLYSTLHLAGYDMPLEQLKNFRQVGSTTPGHPEAHHAPGVEVTTGPLGQGFGNSVGMAIAERYLASRFNQEDGEIVDHYTYVLASDGDLMEGLSHESASLAGHLGLGRLIVLYDSNDISLEGPTDEWFTDATGKRFESYGWQVLQVENAETDVDAICAAIEEAKTEEGKPTLVVCRTEIGYGSPLAGTSKVHGAPLSEEQLQETKKALGWPADAHFLVPDKVKEHFAALGEKGRAKSQKWHADFEKYADAHPDLAAEWRRAWDKDLPLGWDDELPTWEAGDGPIATRAAAGAALEGIRSNCWTLIGGDADLGSSTKTLPDDGRSMDTGDFAPQNIRFGVRELGMAAACNGIERHGGLRAFGSTFLVFSDYCRPALRLAGLMKCGTVYQFTHDSIGLGEDGPTHQPVEHLASLRCIPHWTVIRPADANEAAQAWRAAMLNNTGPTAIACSRQKLPILERCDRCGAEMVHKGAYVLRYEDEGEEADVLLMASGSEVSLCLDAAEALKDKGLQVRVVSFPSWELFERQDDEYKKSVLPPSVTRRIAVEAGATMGWQRYTGSEGAVIGLDRFGSSGPGAKVMETLGFSVENVVTQAEALLGMD